MNIFESATIFLSITALFAYINQRFIKLPSDIGVMAISLGLSLIIILLDSLGFNTLKLHETRLLNNLDFSKVLLDTMLSMLLFAGALHIRSKDLKTYRLPVAFLAFVGTITSAAIVAALVYFIMPLFNIHLPFIWCLIFGALISPTDPIAVMGILTQAGVPKSIETVVAGESLFNDGIGVVLFVLLLGMLASGETPTILHGSMLFAEEALGGIIYGYILGHIAYYLLKTIDSYQEEVLITLATVLGGYTLAHHIGVSGPLAMVVVGLIVGNKGRMKAMSDETREHVDLFWELLDRILNAVLFVLIGLEIIVISLEANIILASLIAIIIALFARLMVVGIASKTLRDRLKLPKGAWKVLTWGGLRGGISVALVLSLPAGTEKNIILGFTYAIVVFSILVQGLTIGKVAKLIQKS